MSSVYIIGTPIGNLGDITIRAVETLKEVDLVVCEDTRVTGKLLNHLGIKKKMISLNAFTEKKNLEGLVSKIKEADKVALVSDAGTPGISDPGTRLVSICRSNDIEIIPIPGPSAIITALSASGFDTSSFVFLGFLPKKKGRQTIFKKMATISETIVFYESPHRILKTLQELTLHFNPPVIPQIRLQDYAGSRSDKIKQTPHQVRGDNSSRKIGIYKEITKIYEEFISGNSSEILDFLGKNKDKIKGEFVVIINSIN
jgi:16S rRNA (cytidine1402-2'-O)-methyltransferase